MRKRRPQFRPTKKTKRARVNGFINAPQVRVIDEEGKQLGVFDTRDAVAMAHERELDLVEVSPVAQPPVCRIMDYGSYQYQQEKKDRKQKSKQKKVEIKGVRLSLKIGPHDLELRKNQALKFFEKGNKVKVELILRGREKAHADRAKELMANFSHMLSDEVELITEKNISRQGGRLFMIVGKK